MKDEIKEVLEALDKIAKGVHYPEDLLYYENCQTLLDYITNLQEEVEYKELWRKEYLKRIDKAVDFINIYTDGINLEAFDCLKLMYKIRDILEGENNE